MVTGLKLPATIMAIVAPVILTGCAQRVATMSCRDVEREAVALSKGALIKITQRHMVTHTKTNLVCGGMGFYSNGASVMTRYRAWLDEDHEIMIAYDTDEAQAAEGQQEEREQNRQIERAERETSDAIDAEMRKYQ